MIYDIFGVVGYGSGSDRISDMGHLTSGFGSRDEVRFFPLRSAEKTPDPTFEIIIKNIYTLGR